MTWQTPKTNWQAADVVSKDDFNRIEGNIQELQDTKEIPAGAQAKANTAEANAKAYTNAHEQKAAPHSGHETPAGAQAKAEAAAGVVRAELDAHKADNTIHKTSNVIRMETNTQLKVEVVSSSVSETPDAGRIIFDTSQGKFFGGNGTEWV